MNEEKNNLPTEEELEINEEVAKKDMQNETKEHAVLDDANTGESSQETEQEEPQEFVKKAKKISVMTFILIAIIFFALMTVVDLIEAFLGHTASLVALVGMAFVLCYLLYGGKKK